MATRPLPENSKNLTVNVPDELHAALGDIAEKLDTKVGTLCRDILENMAANPEKIIAALRWKLENRLRELEQPELISEEIHPGGRTVRKYAKRKPKTDETGED